MEPKKANTKPELRQTEVGLIPADWKIQPVQSFAKISTGDKDTQDRIEEGRYPFFVRSQTVERINTYSFDGEAVLTSGDGVGVGKIYHYLNCKFDYHQRVYNIHDFRKDVFGKYFFYYFSNHFYDRVMSMTAKSSVDSVRREMISEMQIPIPPTLEEQKSIATALSDVDHLISSLEKTIAKKKANKQAAMQQLLTAPHKGGKRLPGFSGKWEEKSLGDVLKIRHGKDQKEVQDKNGGYPILGTGGLMGYTNKFLYNKPSVLIGRKGTIDKPQFMSTPFWTVDTLFYSEIFSDYDAKILYYYFLLIDWISKNEASGVPSLNAKTIEATKIFISPNKYEQEAIAQILDDMSSEIETLEAKKAKYQKVKQGMMQELLTGKTRLV